SGDFSADLFTLKTATTADAISFTYSAIPYLANVKTALHADIEVDNKTNTYRFKTDDISINALKLATEGFFQLVNDSTYNMDIAFKAPSTDFKHVLSLIPAIYQHDFDKIKTSGKAVFNGFVKGKYTSTSLPAYAFNLSVENGFFQYPDLPKPLQNINFALQVENPDGHLDHTVVNITKGHIEMDNTPFDFRLLVKNPVSQLFIDAAAKGSLNLSKVTEFAKMEADTKLAGLLNADVAVTGTMDALQKQQYDNFHAAGTLEVNNFQYASKDYPDGVALNHLLLTFNPRNVTINDVNGKYMKTNFAGTGVINNLLPYLLNNQPLDGQLTVKADQVNLNDWMGVSTDTTTTTASTASAAPFLVPHNINFGINATVDKVHYDKVDLTNLTGNLRIADEAVQLQNVNANALDGTMAVSGSYSTKVDKQHPDISLTYDVKGLNIEKTFNAFNTVQKLMPIGQFLSGKMSSQMSVSGKLGENMMPNLNSLTGQGNLLLVEGVLKKFAPIEGLARTLNIKELETITLKDIKNQIEFANGKVAVKPFKLKVKDIDMEVGGMHGLDQSLAYGLNLKVPRALMGDKGNQLINNLVTQANKKGIPAQLSDVVDLNVKVGGTVLKPTFQTDLKQAGSNLVADLKQQALTAVQQKADSTKTAVKTAVKDTLQSVKNQVVQAAGNELKNKLFGKDTTNATNTGTKPNLKETGKGLIEGINPFKKKKKEEGQQ
ncbi:MAG TPA: AsmA-like C-terminal region-containing protein, partial [Flavisolibacter sp.]|nr:AsmA-like C-terminal region-containing protein [Flavisolibacter sp.]